MSLAISCRLLGTKLKNAYMLGGYVSRNISIEDYKIKWDRPKKIPFSDPKQTGDLGLDITANPDEYRLHFEKSKELQDADDIVKKMFTLEFQRKKETNKVKRTKIMALVQRHICDKGSEEVNIARLTSSIHDLQSYLLEQPKNGKAKQRLKELIDRRGKSLRYLRRWDYARYEWILEQLNLVYKSLPEKPGAVSRRTTLYKLTIKHCKNITQSRINKLKDELKRQQKKFYAEKAEKLAFILKEEIECGLTPTVTEEDIEIARKQAELLNIPEDTHEIE